jgi:hypothetical protein
MARATVFMERTQQNAQARTEEETQGRAQAWSPNVLNKHAGARQPGGCGAEESRRVVLEQ